MMQAAPANDDINQMALFLLITVGMVLLNASVELWSALHSPDRTPTESTNPLFWFFGWFFAIVLLIVKSILIVVLIYNLPAYIIVALIKTLIGGESVSASFLPESADPTFKLAFMIGLTDNFAETLRYKEKVSFTIHFLMYLSFLPICYYGGMVVAWILARYIAAGGGFAPSNVEAAGNLFSLPLFVHNVTQNWVIIVVLILIGGALFHRVIESRRE